MGLQTYAGPIEIRQNLDAELTYHGPLELGSEISDDERLVPRHAVVAGGTAAVVSAVASATLVPADTEEATSGEGGLQRRGRGRGRGGLLGGGGERMLLGERRGSGIGPVILWSALDAMSRSGGSRSGGGFGGGFGGGGGFSGGGGSFGGGGASGGW